MSARADSATGADSAAWLAESVGGLGWIDWIVLEGYLQFAVDDIAVLTHHGD